MILNLSFVSYRMALRPPTPPPPPSELSQIARAMEMMVAAIKQQNLVAQNQQAMMHQWDAMRTTGTSSSSQPQGQLGLADFLKHNPPKFIGSTTPDHADQWIRDIEKIFRATSCSKDQKLNFVSYLLSGEAEFWWAGAQRMMETKVEPITWGSFRERFLEKYFSDSTRFAKEAEFLRLEQGGMFVTAYAARFEYLARFYT